MVHGHLNVEFKARCSHPDTIRSILKELSADYRGKDHQVDVYFNTRQGRLKLRKGNIENNLIAYEREDSEGAKQSKVILLKTQPDSALQEILAKTIGIKVIIDKQRDIYFIENVKFHIDEVDELGSFIEVEAIDKEGTIGKEKLQEQCEHYKKVLGVKDEDLIPVSYSDLLLDQQP